MKNENFIRDDIGCISCIELCPKLYSAFLLAILVLRTEHNSILRFGMTDAEMLLVKKERAREREK